MQFTNRKTSQHGLQTAGDTQRNTVSERKKGKEKEREREGKKERKKKIKHKTLGIFFWQHFPSKR